MTDYRLSEQKYTESEFLFQTIEMAKSDEEYDLEAGTGLGKLHNSLETLISEQKVNKEKYRERKPPCFHRHYSMTNISPPAPPSTPTSSMATCLTPIPSPTFTSSILSEENERLNNSDEQLYYLNNPPPMCFTTPRCMKIIRDQPNTDSELAKLLNVVSITSRKQGEFNHHLHKLNELNKLHPERGISSSSRTIRKLNMNTKSYKLHRSNPKEFFREPDDEDSVSAPEYDSQEEHILYRRFTRFKYSKKYLQTRRQRRFARFEHQERMEEIVDSFGATMKINDI